MGSEVHFRVATQAAKWETDELTGKAWKLTDAA